MVQVGNCIIRDLLKVIMSQMAEKLGAERVKTFLSISDHTKEEDIFE